MQHNITESEKIRPAMVENAVQNDFYSFSMTRLHQFGKFFFVAEAGVNFQVIRRVVFMPTVGCKNRRQIKTVNSQILQIIQVAPNTGQSTAVLRVIFNTVTFNCSGSAAYMSRSVGKAIGINLVNHRFFQPRRNSGHIFSANIVKIVIKLTIGIRLGEKTVIIVIKSFAGAVQFKVIAQTGNAGIESYFIIIKQSILLSYLHLPASYRNRIIPIHAIPVTNITRIQIIQSCSEP